jgi:hypothetical protein
VYRPGPLSRSFVLTGLPGFSRFEVSNVQPEVRQYSTHYHGFAVAGKHDVLCDRELRTEPFAAYIAVVTHHSLYAVQ